MKGTRKQRSVANNGRGRDGRFAPGNRFGFKPGQSGNPLGRRRGVPNKTTQLLKDAILLAAAEAGGGDIVAYLARQADENPVAFMGLLSKVLPTEVTQEPRPAFNIGEIRLVAPDLRLSAPAGTDW